MTHLSAREVFDAFDFALEVSSRWPRLLLALGFDTRIDRPGPRALNSALQDRGFGPVVDEALALESMLATYPDTWWFAIAQETTGYSDASVQQVVDALNARASRHAAQ